MSLLFTNQTGNGDSDEFSHKGGSLQVAVVGTFDSASIQPRINQDNLGFIDFGNPIVNQVAFKIGSKASDFKFVLSDAGGSTNISLSAL